MLLKGVAVALAGVLAISCAWAGTQGAQAYSAPTTWDDLSKTGYRPTDGIASYANVINNLNADNMSITSGADTWEFEDALNINGRWTRFLHPKSKITSTGWQSLDSVTLFCKESCETVDGELLDMELALSPVTYISANTSAWGKMTTW